MFAVLSWLTRPISFLGSKARGRKATTLLLLIVACAGVYCYGLHHFHAAVEATRQFQLDQASRHLHCCLAVWPKSYRASLLAARICRLQGQLGEAQAYLAECRRIAGMTEELEREWMLWSAEAGNFASLEPKLRELADDSLDALQTLVSCLIKEARFHRAGHYLDRWVAAHPSGKAYFLRGLVYENLGLAEYALNDYREAINLDAQRWEARLHMASLLMAKDPDEARNHLEFLKQSHPDKPDVWYLQGLDCLRRGQLEEADTHLARVLEALPNYGNALYQSAQVLLAKGKLREAEERMRQAVQADPDLPVAHYGLYLCLQNQAGREMDAQLALSAYKDAVGRAPRLKVLMEKIEKEPGNADLLVEASELFLQRRQWQQHQRYLHKALQIQPSHSRALTLKRLLADAPDAPR